MVKKMKNIMETLLKYKQALEKDGYNVLYIALYGSQNYGVSDEYSDIDAKAIVLPKIDDIVFIHKLIDIQKITQTEVKFQHLITLRNSKRPLQKTLHLRCQPHQRKDQIIDGLVPHIILTPPPLGQHDPVYALQFPLHLFTIRLQKPFDCQYILLHDPFGIHLSAPLHKVVRLIH